jgi:hypothetical protein
VDLLAEARIASRRYDVTKGLGMQFEAVLRDHRAAPRE